MAIGRVPGAALLGNLDRQGLDLGFTTNSDTLLQLDFTNFRLGINTASPQEALHVTGNVLVTTGNVLTSANLLYDIGSSSNRWRNIYSSNVYIDNITSTNIAGTLTTAAQTNITSLGTLGALTVSGNIIAQSSVVPSSNISGNIGYADKWWSTVYANTVNSTNLYGTILTANQPNITNLGNVTVDSISIGGNISITGNVNGTDIVANTITANLIYGTIDTATQPYISNLGNITANSITINSNLSIDGTTTANIINANIVSEGGYRVVTSNTTVNVTGDVTGSGNVSNIALTLANTGVVAGVYGSADDEYADRIPKITVDSKGRITNIANVTLTQVGNVTFTNTTISTTANLTLAPANSYIFAGNSTISNVANPVAQQDVVTLNYLSSAIGAASKSIFDGDSLLEITDDATGRLELTLDSELIANITANTSTFYNTVNIGNISIDSNTISSPGNIYLNAQNTGIVHILGTDALGIPAGNSSARPLNPELGYIRFNTGSETLEYWTGTEWTYPGAATITSETITPDGTNASYTLSEEATPDALIVSINGTLQQPFTSYIMTGNLITFIETPQNTDIIEVRHIAAGATTVSSLFYSPTSKIELSEGNINITGNLLPSANVTYDLGSESLWWRDLYMSGSTIHIGGALLKVVDNALSFTPAGSATPINLSNDINPSLLYSGNSNVTVAADFVNVAINSNTVASFSSTVLATSGNINATNFNYTNGVSILDSVTSSLTTLTSNAATQSGLIADTNTAITTANTGMKGYVDGQISTTTSAITTANTNMNGYVDGQITIVTNSVTGANAAIVTANTAMKGYVDAQDTIISNSVTGANAAIVTANTAMKGYVDAINSTLTANAGAQAGTLATIQSTYAQLSGATFTGAVVAPNITLTAALAISSGGTGATSSSEALNNLFPSGEVSGYVLKTSGPGSYYWTAESGASSTVGTTISTSRTYKTATAGQTVFTGLGTYTPGAGQLRIYLNGVRQFDSAYTETNSSAVTLSTGVSSGTVLLAEVDGYTDFTSYASDVVFSNVGGISATNVQDALAELDTEKAALAGASFTGNVTTTGNVSITSTLSSSSSSTGALVVTGGVGIGGNLYIGGNLQVAGNVTYFDSNNVTFNDAMIYLADDNTGDVLDIGFVSSFTNPGYQHTGFVRDATDGVWKLFANVAAEPTTTIDFTNATYSNLRIGNLTSIGGTFTGNVGAGNLSATNLTGTLTTAAQTNVTSVGTLTGLTVSGAPVPNANVSVNLGSTSAWWSTFYANTHVGATATFTGNITAGNVSATNLTGSITSGQVTTALGFTPYNSTNPSGYLSTAVTSAVAGTGVSVSAGTGAVTFSIGQAVATSSNVRFASFGVGTAASNTAGEIRATNNITAYYSSDSRLKENVRDIPDALAKVTAIGGKLFDWTDEYVADHGGLDDYFMRKADFGVIAQDVAQVLPEAVRTREDGYLAVDYEKMCALAFAAIKELQQQVRLLEQQIKDK
jgi:hypothetical protein